jgi:hypothetical protein
MSPRHFYKNYVRQSHGQPASEHELDIEKKVEHAIQFAFAPITRTYKHVANSRRFFRRGRQSDTQKPPYI